MSSDNVLRDYLPRWKESTGNLPWGAQKVFHETLESVKDGQVSLGHGADFNGKGNPCLVNAVATMLSANQGNAANPMGKFPDVVRAFDTINSALFIQGVNTESNVVSPLAAEILLHNFGELKERPPEAVESTVHQPFVEPTDADMARSWVEAMNTDAACEVEVPEITDAEINQSMIDAIKNS